MRRDMFQSETEMNRLLERLKEAEERIERLSLLSHLGQILNSTLDHQEVRKRAIEAATQLMRAEAGSLLLLDEEGKHLFFEVALGDKGESVKKVILDVDKGIAGWVAKKGEPLRVNHPERDPRFYKEMDERIGFKTRNILCVPVRVKDRILGVLEAINKKGGEDFNEEDLSLFVSLANQVAIALDNARLYQELEEMFFQTAASLAEVIEKRDPYTGGHTQRVTRYSLAVAKYLSLEPEELRRLRIASVLHDIGKIGIDDQILRKPTQLDTREVDLIRRHPKMGAEIIGHIKQLKEIIPGVKYHHEHMNGKGYPEGLMGEGIPMIARIVAVADTYDAITTDRPYRKALSKETAISELKKGSGTQFDQKVVEAFLQAFHSGEI